MITTATEDGDEYVLDGKKIWITSGPLADIITVYAKTGTEGGAAGITAFMVPTDTPGFHVGEPIEKLGLEHLPVLRARVLATAACPRTTCSASPERASSSSSTS